jgi:hypothetical protein
VQTVTDSSMVGTGWVQMELKVSSSPIGFSGHMRIAPTAHGTGTITNAEISSLTPGLAAEVISRQMTMTT